MASKELNPEPLAPGAGDIEGGSPSSGEALSDNNHGESVMEFNVINFSTPQGRQILHDIAGQTHSGEFTALMGPSGAGKTTLMDCIALRQRRFEGAIHLDGKSPKGDYYTQTGYVHQKEMFFSMLTTREHLTFHAINRLGGRYSRDSCLRRVEEVLKEVEMVRQADTIIGGGEFALVKGLSGGERKRLAIGTELLSHPKILFLDEPTSGLDSVMGEVITNLLRDLASGLTGGKKRIIFCVIHTPSSRMWMSFSHVILLATGGWLAYHGSREALMPFFRSLGYSVPAEYNPADYALEVVSARPGNEVEGKTAAFVVESFQTKIKDFNRLPAETDHLATQAIAGGSSSLIVQTKMNVWRAVVNQMREKAIIYALIGMLFMLGLVFGLLFLQQAHGSWRNLMGMIYALVVAVLILCSMNVALHFPVEWSIFMREYYTGANALGPYFMGRCIADVPYLLLFLIMVIIPYWMGGLSPDFLSFLRYCFIFLLIIQASASVGYLASSFSQNPTLGLAMTPIIATPMILFSGMLYERSRVPFFLKWMQYFSIVNYGVASLVINELNAIGDGPTRWLVLHFLQLSMDEYTISVIAVALLAIGYRVASFCVLKMRMRMEVSL